MTLGNSLLALACLALTAAIAYIWHLEAVAHVTCHRNKAQQQRIQLLEKALSQHQHCIVQPISQGWTQNQAFRHHSPRPRPCSGRRILPMSGQRGTAKPSSTRTHKVYTFHHSSYVLHPAQLIVENERGLVSEHYLSPRQYDRFVALANSRRYDIRIHGSDYGTAWSLQRFPTDDEISLNVQSEQQTHAI